MYRYIDIDIHTHTHFGVVTWATGGRSEGHDQKERKADSMQHFEAAGQRAPPSRALC